MLVQYVTYRLITSADAVETESREKRRSLILSPLLCPVWSTQCRASTTAPWASFCLFHYTTLRDQCKSFKELCCFYTVQRQITGAYFNASQSSSQCLCGNLALLTHYLKSLGLLSSSGIEESLHTSCCQDDSLSSYLAWADPRHVLEIRQRGGVAEKRTEG